MAQTSSPLAWQPQSPFLSEAYWETPPELASPTLESSSAQLWESPFGGEHPFLRETQGEGETVSPELEFLADMEQQLHDPEFEDAVARFSSEVVGLYEAQREAYGASFESEAVEATTERFGPALREFESALDRLSAEAGPRDVFEMEAETIDQLFARHRPAGDTYGEYEYLFESFWKKAKGAARAARGAGAKAKKKGARGIKGKILAKLLNMLKRVFRMLLKRVLAQAIGKLPANLRPAALRLRNRLLGRLTPAAREPEPEPEPDLTGDEPDTGAGEPVETSAPMDDSSLEPDEGAGDTGSDVSGATEDADTAIAASLFEVEAEFEAEFQPEAWAGSTAANAEADLQQARQQFLEALAQAKPGEELAPHLDQFIPAILPALKMASRFGLRAPIAKALGRLIGRFIQKIVGPQTATPLGQAIANQGLRMMGFETHEAALAGGGALPVNLLVAQTVEGTVQRLAETAGRLGLESRDLENPALFEALAAQSFERAAAANWPGRMLRPEVRESSHLDAAWVLAPETGKKYYKRGPKLRVKIDPATADQISVFAGKNLGQFLFVEKGLERRPIEAIAHLYEAIPGTWLSRISLHEKQVPGLGSARQEAWGQIHPLTTEAAGFLLGSAGLGRPFAAKWMNSPHKVQIGLRYFYLEILNAPTGPRPAAGPVRPNPPMGAAAPILIPQITAPPAPATPQPSQINTVVDCQRNRIVVALFLAEHQAQRVAASFRSGDAGTVLFQAVTSLLDAVAQNMADGKGKHIKVIPRAQQLFKRRRRPVLRMAMMWFRKFFFKWLGRVFVKLVEREMEAFKTAFIKAADDAAWGVTVRVELDNPPAMEAICAALEGKLKLPPMGAVEIPKAQWSVVAGFRND